jgi:phage terminase large subunit GpA-like protein
MQPDASNPLVAGFFEGFKIPTRLTVTQWADEFRMLPSKGAAAPGKYRSSRTPYMRAPMDDLSATSPVEEIILMAAAQTGKSESGNNWVGYVIDNAPGPMMLVQPTVDNAKRYSKQRITPMILESPSLAEKVIDNKSRDSGNTILEKEFPGGILLMGGANSAAGLRSTPVRYLFCDEISNWPADVDGEGDPLELAEARTTTFGRKRKIFKCSTPGIKGVCRIESEYKKTDQRKYFVPCPHCGEKHILEWRNFIIPTDEYGKKLTSQAHMGCPECGGVINEHHKTDMLNGGEWRSTCPDNADKTRAGYHISALYSPIGWKSWEKVAKQWIEAQGNPKKLQTFINNVLAETWEEKGESIDEHAIAQRAEHYGPDILPDGVLVITSGVDVQPNRLEVEVVGWGLGEESWSIDHKVIMGDPNGPVVWQLLDLYLATEYRHPVGVSLRVARSFVDTGGENTQAVYAYVGVREHLGIYGIKGMGGDGKPPVGPPSKSNLGKIPLVPLGTFVLKDTIYGRLRIEEPGPGYMHFRKSYAADYYKQLTAEEVRTKHNSKGFPVREWYKKSAGSRNEVLDCWQYALASFISLGINLEQLEQMLRGAVPDNDNGRRVRGSVEPMAA